MTDSGKAVELAELNDEARAKLEATHAAEYKFNKQQMIDLVEKYRQRKYVEDLDYIKSTFDGVKGLCEGLKVDPEQGVSSFTLDSRHHAFGDHKKDLPPRTTLLEFIIEIFKEDMMLQVLIVCAIFSIVVDMSFADHHERKHAWIEGCAILIAVAVVSLVSAVSDYKKEGQFLKQQKIDLDSKVVQVMRDGKEETKHRDHLKVGDIVKIQNGMNIPVDGVCVEANGVLSDESSMTGESDHLMKETYEKCLVRQAEHEEDDKHSKTPHDIPSPILLSGTQIQTGQGWFLTIVVGPKTCENQILAAIENNTSEVTPLQIKLQVIATDIGKLGMYCAILIIHCLLLRKFIESMMRRNFDLWGGELTKDGAACPVLGKKDDTCGGFVLGYVKDLLGYYIVGVAIIVVAVPEGLPLAVMISLSYSISKMLQDQNFVKKLASCEIMGGANNICSDKTGTLTKNQMTWTQIWAGHDYKLKDVDGPTPYDSAELGNFLKNEKTKELLSQAVSCNCIGTVDDAGATELAMLKFIKKCNVDYEAYRKQMLPKEYLRFQFDSSRKRMSTVLELPEPHEKSHHKRLHTKGASEIVVETCSHYLDESGSQQPLDDLIKQQLADIIQKYAKQALRTIAFAYKDLEADEGGPEHDNKEDGSKIYDIESGGLTLIGIAGIKDIIREEVPGAVLTCATAGVRVRMVTGDNKITAIAIAKECGIINDQGEENEECVCMEGPEFNKYVGSLVDRKTKETILVMGKDPANETIGNIEHMKKVRDKLKVLARSRPNDKYIMVSGLKQLGDIVAVTGDGTNDAPALKKADVGFAMKTGTQVAHSAADIIIQDDNFASIVKACKWGRNVFDNIRRFLQFQLTVNVVALITSFIGSVVMWESPLQAIQLLWVNLIMDSLASLALATEEPKDDLLQRPPYRKREYIISQKMVKHILGMSIFQAIILFGFVFGAPSFVPEECDPLTGPFYITHPLPEIYSQAPSYDGIDPPTDADGKVMRVENPEEVQTYELSSYTVDDYKSYAQFDKSKMSNCPELVLNGMVQSIDGTDLYRHFEGATPSRHLSVVFNLFVFMQIFNMLGARKINDEVNIFEGVWTNAMFIGVWITIVGGQILMVVFGGWAMKVHLNGLTTMQWVMSCALGAASLLINLILKFVPEKFFPTMGDEDQASIDAAKKDYQALLNLRKIKELSGSIRNRGLTS